MEQDRANQYDDDLTVGLDDSGEESFDTGYVDLFEYAGEEASPIADLKTVVLSLEWEITDDLLIDFNEELTRVAGAWSDDPVKLVYVQALQKISKYIYQKKSDAHPNAMRVLLAFYYDLEKIVLDHGLSAAEKQAILQEDVKKFERFKQQVGQAPGAPPAPRRAEVETAPAAMVEDGETHPDLYNLKACILAIDWEIGDKELAEISAEIKRLQSTCASSRTRSKLLEGLAALGGYVKLKRGDSDGDVFKLINSFYEALEKIFTGALSRQQEKEMVLAEAARFNAFKEKIAPTITPEAIARAQAAGGEPAGPDDEPAAPASGPAPPFFDGGEAGEDDGFTAETLDRVSAFFDDRDGEDRPASALTAEEALRGVEVETEADDDSGEEALPTLGDGGLAPALAETERVDELAPASARGDIGSAVPGVDVESDDDDDSDDVPLPLDDGEIAPALFDAGAPADVETAKAAAGEEAEAADISEHVEQFFGVDEGDFEVGELDEGVDEATDEFDALLPPALTDADEEQPPATGAPAGGADDTEEQLSPEDISARLDSFFGPDDAPGGEFVPPPADPSAAPGFAPLKAHLDGLGPDSGNDELDALRTDIEGLRDRFVSKPVEKTLLHLMGVAVDHLDQGRADYGDDARAIIDSLYESLVQVDDPAVDMSRALEVLAEETAKIVQWQKTLIDRIRG